MIQSCQCNCCKTRGKSYIEGMIDAGKIAKNPDEAFFLDIIRKWKSAWMNQHLNGQADHDNYFRRAFGVDANMVHSLAHRLVEALK